MFKKIYHNLINKKIPVWRKLRAGFIETFGGSVDTPYILRAESSRVEPHQKNSQVPESARQSGRGRIGSAGGNVFLENVR